MGLEMIKDRQSLLRLFTKLANSPALQSVHLSENHFRQDPTMHPIEAEFFNKLLNRFGISPPMELDPLEMQERDEITKTCKEAIDKINMNKHLKNDG
jgi:hypothetical protein